MKKINIFYSLITLFGVLFFYSCSEDNELVESRLFSPVLNKDLTANLNTITVDMADFKDAVSYKIEISRDTFKTVSKIKTYTSTESRGIIRNLLWNTTYQVRATAIAASPEFNSKVSYLGAVKTDPFPSDLKAPSKDDIIDTQVRVEWNVTSSPITTVKVFAADDEELLTPLASYDTDNAEQLAGAKIISGLTPGTTYQLAIYKGTVINGWSFYTTLPALPTGADVTDLRGLPVTSTSLFDALTNTPAGGTIILDPSQTYGLSTNYFFDKSLTIKSGYTLANSTGAILNNTSTGTQFELAASAVIDKITFEGVSFVGDTALGRYVMNASAAVSASVGELRFVNVKITGYRDVIRTRTQWTSGGIGLLTIDNCIITSISSNGVVIVDASSLTNPFNPLTKIVLKNSTFSKVQKLINNRATTDSASLTISDCTFSETPAGAGILLEYTASTDVTDGIVIKNCIFGGSTAASPNYSFIRSGHLLATAISSSNTYKTNDFIFTPPTAPAVTPVPSFSVYAGSITALWVDPLNGDFNFEDATFAGSKTSGDPRWRKQ